MQDPRTLPAGLCARCGGCVPVCPVFRQTARESDSGRGLLALIERFPPESGSPKLAEILSRCLLCGGCDAACPRGIEVSAAVAKARNRISRQAGKKLLLRKLAGSALKHPAAMALASRAARLLPRESGLFLRLGLEPPGRPSPPPSPPQAPMRKPEAGEIALFPGCLAAHLEPEIIQATDRLLRRHGLPSPFQPEGQGCCGLAALASGDLDTARELARRNIRAFEPSRGKILATCASCATQLARYPALFDEEPEWRARAETFSNRVTEFSLFFSGLDRPEKKKHTEGQPCRVWYHDPCHLRHHLGVTREPRRMLSRLPGIVLANPETLSSCCGGGGFFFLAHPEIADQITAELAARLPSPLPQVITTTCTGCLLRLRSQAAKEITPSPRVVHLAVLLDRA